MTQQNSISSQQMINTLMDVPTQQYPKRQFYITRCIGEGGEGAVYQVKTKNGNYTQDLALKLQINMKEQEKQFIQQLINYQRLYDKDQQQSSSGVISIIEVFQYQNYHALLMELGAEDLYVFLSKKNGSISMARRYSICIDLLRPIYYLHHRKVFHRDIKPENFILVGNYFKLIDFGLIKGNDVSLNRTKGVGTLQYQAPELIDQNENYDEKVDIWALACVFYEVLSGESLFYADNQDGIKNQVLKFKDTKEIYFKKIDQLRIPHDCQKTLKLMLNPDYKCRISISEALDTFIKCQKQVEQDQSVYNQLKFPNQVQSFPNQNLNYQQSSNSIFQTQHQPIQQPAQTLQNKSQQNQVYQQVQYQRQQPFNQFGQNQDQMIQQQCQQYSQQFSQQYSQQFSQLLFSEIKQLLSQDMNLQKQDKDVQKQQIEEEEGIYPDFQKATDDVTNIIKKLNNQMQKENEQYKCSLEQQNQIIKKQETEIQQLKDQLSQTQQELERMKIQMNQMQYNNDFVDNQQQVDQVQAQQQQQQQQQQQYLQQQQLQQQQQYLQQQEQQGEFQYQTPINESTNESLSRNQNQNQNERDVVKEENIH